MTAYAGLWELVSVGYLLAALALTVWITGSAKGNR